MSTQQLGSVLVVGGCGFVGYSIVSKLVNEPNCSVSVISRNPRHPRVVGVSYNACDITDIQGLRTLIQQIQPQIILRMASPHFYQDKVDEKLLHQVNVVGTRNLLDTAILTESVKAFVYTSSNSVHAGSEFCFIMEDAPLPNEFSKADKYATTKALADAMVLQANCREVRTLCILALLREKKTHFQLGDNTNLYDSIYVDNAASAHLMAAKALLRDKASRPKVHGEAFFITDGNPMPFWDFQREIWVAAGDKTPLTKVIIVPAWIGMLMATVVEYVFWIFTFGQELPPKTMRRNVLRYAFTNRTFCINKARERLGYRPLVDTDVGIQRGVKWALENRGTHDATEIDTGL
ncbi:hypothetical protein JMJ35_002870 [Cladonia borealis]|uniref:Ketoreductase domain-containing protein n=1 Tax=Cladonia borealis TaxID=184061 RepID=A0AA39R6J9_9LECA|nr:hypothetical protein JMJ35_002870 [Cladonia borealis]